MLLGVGKIYSEIKDIDLQEGLIENYSIVGNVHGKINTKFDQYHAFRLSTIFFDCFKKNTKDTDKYSLLKYFFDDKYSFYYKNLLSNFLNYSFIISHGVTKNKYLKDMIKCETDLEPRSVLFRRSNLDRIKIADYLFNFYFLIDKNFYNYKLPS